MLGKILKIIRFVPLIAVIGLVISYFSFKPYIILDNNISVEKVQIQELTEPLDSVLNGNLFKIYFSIKNTGGSEAGEVYYLCDYSESLDRADINKLSCPGNSKISIGKNSEVDTFIRIPRDFLDVLSSDSKNQYLDIIIKYKDLLTINHSNTYRIRFHMKDIEKYSVSYESIK